MFGKKGSKILKLPPVRNCFTLAITNKLVVIINSLKVPKIKKILLYEMKFLVPNYSCLQNPWLWGLPPPDPRSLCPLSSTEFVEPPTPDKILGYATAWLPRHVTFQMEGCSWWMRYSWKVTFGSFCISHLPHCSLYKPSLLFFVWCVSHIALNHASVCLPPELIPKTAG